MPTLIGREAELDRVTGLLGRRGALVVTGGRGSGRSRLLTVAAERAHDRGHRVVALPAPAEPLTVVRRLLLAVRRDLPALASADARAALAFLELAPGPPPADPARAARAVLAELDQRRPLFLTVDDVDLLPAATAALVSTVTGVAGAVLLAGRADRIPAPLTRLPRLTLPPLGPRDSIQLLETRPHPPTGRARAEVLHHAAGNPAALLELGGGDGPLRSEFARRVAALPDPTGRLLLHLAAVTAPGSAGPSPAGPVDPRLVAAAAGVAGTAWPAAERAGLIVAGGSAVAFVHPVAADVVYHAATAHQRAQAHRGLARHRPEQWGLHLAAVTSGPDETVAAGWEAAGAGLRSRGELMPAALAMERAAARSPGPEAAARRLARAVADTHRLGAAGWTADLTAAMRRLGTDPESTASAEFTAALALSRSGRQHDAYGVITAARRSGRSATVAMTRLVASVAAISGQAGHRRGLAGLLAEVAPQLDPADLVLMRLISDPADPAGRAFAALIEPPRPGDDRRTLAVRGTIAAFADRSDLAVALLRAVRDDEPGAGPALVARGETDTALGAVGDTNPALVAALIDTGRWPLADRVADSIDASGLPVLRAALEALRAHLQALRGDSAGAMRLVRCAWARIDVEQHRSVHIRLLRAAGLAAMVAGDHDDAYRYLRSMFDREGRPLEPFLAGRGIADLVSAAVRSGHADEARPILAAVRAEAGADPTVRLQMLLHHAEALLTDGPEADHRFELVTGCEAAAEWPFELAQARLHHGEWLRRARRPRDARARLSAAATTFAELGATRPAEYAQRELQASGSTARSGLLTPQEQQVAELAARGLRNREIAELLFISVRTVGAHLRSVYPKLGISGRHHLPAALGS
ncbi:LuxR C-terminal-related transcriptional regulator [Actinoplanes sp. TRM 88003]|uniref:LuxR C-terminal-related transcriptional regulator n=1 Tax=Paractinoplanes aksuensis TaxID=2939490 RepID=A0ABT1DVL1_9ACTN|nr:LuxR family transcriptional regulator [Actinoplanes aksuensis]MCO8273686.1 LuxR C-terminal-related transcriptional regulator [Actinoplanes aksuensis]